MSQLSELFPNRNYDEQAVSQMRRTFEAACQELNRPGRAKLSRADRSQLARSIIELFGLGVRDPDYLRRYVVRDLFDRRCSN